MNLLLLDSTQTQLVVALAVNGKITVTKTCDEQRQHDKNVNRLISELGVDKFDAVAVVTGPGSWTGIRVGLAVAKAFAYAQGIPLIELRDKIDVKEAMRKFKAGETVSPFAIQPCYNGEFIVKTKSEIKE